METIPILGKMDLLDKSERSTVVPSLGRSCRLLFMRCLVDYFFPQFLRSEFVTIN